MPRWPANHKKRTDRNYDRETAYESSARQKKRHAKEIADKRSRHGSASLRCGQDAVLQHTIRNPLLAQLKNLRSGQLIPATRCLDECHGDPIHYFCPGKFQNISDLRGQLDRRFLGSRLGCLTRWRRSLRGGCGSFLGDTRGASHDDGQGRENHESRNRPLHSINF